MQMSQHNLSLSGKLTPDSCCLSWFNSSTARKGFSSSQQFTILSSLKYLSRTVTIWTTKEWPHLLPSPARWVPPATISTKAGFRTRSGKILALITGLFDGYASSSVRISRICSNNNMAHPENETRVAVLLFHQCTRRITIHLDHQTLGWLHVLNKMIEIFDGPNNEKSRWNSLLCFLLFT